MCRCRVSSRRVRDRVVTPRVCLGAFQCRVALTVVSRTPEPRGQTAPDAVACARGVVPFRAVRTPETARVRVLIAVLTVET